MARWRTTWMPRHSPPPSSCLPPFPCCASLTLANPYWTPSGTVPMPSAREFIRLTLIPAGLMNGERGGACSQAGVSDVRRGVHADQHCAAVGVRAVGQRCMRLSRLSFRRFVFVAFPPRRGYSLDTCSRCVWMGPLAGPYALITTAISADLGTHASLKGSAQVRLSLCIPSLRNTMRASHSPYVPCTNLVCIRECVGRRHLWSVFPTVCVADQWWRRRRPIHV